MGLGRIFGKRKRKDWLDTVKPEELEKERLRIDNQIQVLFREIQRLERTKKELFKQGIGKSEVEKMLLAKKIKNVDAEVRMKLREYNTLMKQRGALSSLIRLKKWEAPPQGEGHLGENKVRRARETHQGPNRGRVPRGYVREERRQDQRDLRSAVH